MYINKQVEPHLNRVIVSANESQAAHLYVVKELMERRRTITSAVKSLNRYSIQPGKTFGTSAKSPNKFKVLRVLADDIVVQDLSTQRIQTFQVDNLLKDWGAKGFKEISLLEDIIATVRTLLGPLLGIFLTAALVAWLNEKIGK